MKKSKNLYGITAIALVIIGFTALSLAGCSNEVDEPEPPPAEKPAGKPGTPSGPFTSIDAMGTWLYAQPANTPATAYTIKLNMGSLEEYPSQSVKNVFQSSYTKYVYLDLSGSTMSSIGDYAVGSRQSLSGCTNLTGITLPNSITIIWPETFSGCTSLKSVTIPNNVTSIGNYAFSGCTSLASVTIPNSVTSIGDGAFDKCASLTAINIDAGNTTYSSEQGVLFNKNKTTLIQCPPGKTGAYTIPNSVTSIESGDFGAFGDCTKLTSVIIPNSVTSIGNSTFFGCTSLKSVTIPASVTSIGDAAFSGCTSLASVTIPNSVTSIGHGAFEGCTGLTSVTIPNSVTSIGDGAFYGCTGLTSVMFQGTITWDKFSSSSFGGDLRDKYLAGGPGTYTTTAPADPNSVWTKL